MSCNFISPEYRRGGAGGQRTHYRTYQSDDLYSFALPLVVCRLVGSAAEQERRRKTKSLEHILGTLWAELVTMEVIVHGYLGRINIAVYKLFAGFHCLVHESSPLLGKFTISC